MNSAQKVSVSLSPTLRPSNSRRPSSLTPMATTTAREQTFGDAALGAERRHQRIDLAGGDPTDVGLHDHRIQGLIDPAAGFEDRREEAAGPQFRDLQGQIPHLGGEGARPVAVSLVDTLLAALMAISTNDGRGLQLDQLLQAVAGQLRDQLPGAASIE